MLVKKSEKGAGRRIAYHAFISYSRRDTLAATGIQKALHRIGRRPGRLHALRVFRDSTDLVASPDLWGGVQEALDGSEYLIVLLSSSAATSEWVNQEVVHWIQQRGLDRLLLVLVDGHLEWDPETGCFDPALSTAAVPALVVPGSLPTEPIYVDISNDSPWDPTSATFRDKVIDLAAPIHGKSKYELASDDVREQRRYRRLRRAAVAGLAMLTVLAVVGAGVAVGQRREAGQQREQALFQRNQAEVRRILGDAESILAGDRSGGDVQGFQMLLAANALSADLAAGSMLDAAIRRRTTKKIISLPDERVSAMAISPAGDWAVVGSYRGAVRVLDTRTGRTVATVSEPESGDDLDPQVQGVVIDPDGRWFAAGQYSGTIRLWDSRSHELLTTITADDLLEEIAVSPDGRRLVSMSGGPGQMWDTATGAQIGDLGAGRYDMFTSVVFSRDGSRIAGGKLKGVMLWDTGGKTIADIPTAEIVTAVALSSDGTRLATGEDSGNIRLWDARTGASRGTLLNARTRVNAIAFTLDGQRLFTAGDDGVVRMWNSDTGQPLGELTGHTAGIYGLATSADGTVLASESADETVRLWEVGTDGGYPVLDADSEMVQALDFSRDGNRLATGGSDSIARIWDATTGALQKWIEVGGPPNAILNLAISPDGHRVATVGEYSMVRLWDADTGELIRDLIGHTGQTMAIDYSPDGQMLVSGDIDGRIVLWDLAQNEPPLLVASAGVPVTSVVFSPDGNLVASAGDDQMVRLWDLRERKLAKVLWTDEDILLALAFSDDGQLLAGAGADQTVRVWDVPSGELTQTLSGHNGDVGGVAFSPVSRDILASGGEDGAVRLWNVKTGQPIGAPFIGHVGQVRGVAFRPDGTVVAGGGSDGKVRFSLAGATPEMLCDKIIYNMNEAQWRRWISPDIEFQADLCAGLPSWSS